MNYMSDRILLDTNILVYSFDNKHSIKQKIAKKMIESLFENDNYFLSIQVLNEFSNVALRKLNPPLEIEEIRELIAAFPEKK
jgi:predicted nucleic acid-binding protein